MKKRGEKWLFVEEKGRKGEGEKRHIKRKREKGGDIK